MWNRIIKSIFFTGFLCAIAAFTSWSAARMVIQAVRVQHEAEATDAEIRDLEREKARLEKLIAELKTPHAAERKAKELHNLKRPGEEVAVILPKAKEEKEKEENNKETLWQSLMRRLFQ